MYGTQVSISFYIVFLFSPSTLDADHTGASLGSMRISLTPTYSGCETA